MPITLRSGNGLVFTSRFYTRTVHQYGLKQEFIRPYTPQKNGMVESPQIGNLFFWLWKSTRSRLVRDGRHPWADRVLA